eukprot:9294677-Lingulodinium_polyedra.AAC.1
MRAWRGPGTPRQPRRHHLRQCAGPAGLEPHCGERREPGGYEHAVLGHLHEAVHGGRSVGIGAGQLDQIQGE